VANVEDRVRVLVGEQKNHLEGLVVDGEYYSKVGNVRTRQHWGVFGWLPSGMFAVGDVIQSPGGRCTWCTVPLLLPVVLLLCVCVR